MSRAKFAFFIGGPLDGQRRTVHELRPSQEVLHVAMTTVPASRVSSEERLETTRLCYQMVSRPINPRRDLRGSPARYTHDVMDAEVGVYFYAGSDPAK